MEKLILLHIHEKKKARIIFIFLTFMQIIINYFLYKYKLCESNLSDLLYVPITIASFVFSIPTAISQGLLGGGLLSVAYKLSIGGEFKDLLIYALQHTSSYVSAALIIGVLKNKLERFYLRQEEMFYIDEFTGLLNMSAFNRDIKEIGEEKTSPRIKMVLVEIVNQYEISAAFGQQMLFKMQAVLQQSAQELLGCEINVYQIQLNTLLIAIPVGQNTERLEAIGDPKQIINVEGVPIFLNVVCGVCEYPRDGITTNELLQKGYIALQEAHHRNQFFYEYDPSLDVPQKIILLGQIQSALEKKEIVFHYQPILNAKGSVHSVEALVRWDHPQMGLLSPSLFIPDLELTGIANYLVDYSLDYNLEKLKTVVNEGFHIQMAINISIMNLQQLDFTERVLSALKKYDLSPSCLILEITERGFLADSEESSRNINDLSRMGVSFHIDDFGVGFTSIGILRKFGIHSIKIDHSYITDLPGNEVNEAVVKCVVSMAKRIGLKTVAEGVEDINLMPPLKKMGVNYFQGYAIARPMPFDELQVWLKEHSKSRKLLK
ncbi:MAG TPA: hypothetical protein DCK95_10975 [Anaerolineaceae bacterium]|uniref:Diguanylate cyclase/phosphodiesterase n=1 Tax=Anaerolinea thermophila TaxID=167964 RepID=A0A101FXS2_9CHLR|nr:MAG: Diguanylate cyclase/phosphodiesterase [Anaerolinea thermophila]HAF62829.1 hypothetical protein [Anaerolineaceae bacterium]